MKKILLSIFLLFTVVVAFAQPIPADSLYLGQTPPGSTPKVFPLPIRAKSFAAERIAISNDGKSIYYQELDGYSEMDGKPHTQRIKCVSFSNGKWGSPITLFEGYGAPALSIGGDTIYMQSVSKAAMFNAYYSVKSSSGWSSPRRFLNSLNSTHYFQPTKSGNCYISSNATNGLGGLDRCRLLISGTDTVASSLGRPVNTYRHDFDYYVALDESFMVATFGGGLGVTYPKADGGWTSPRMLGSKINFGLGAWGTYITADNRYLFFTTGTKEDYSDTYVYWVRIDGVVDSLRNTNSAPYYKLKPAEQQLAVGKPFSYTLPDNTFVDDEGTTNFTYAATLVDGSALPVWLNFNTATRTFTGTPTEGGLYSIAIAATDPDKATGYCPLTINVAATPAK